MDIQHSWHLGLNQDRPAPQTCLRLARFNAGQPPYQQSVCTWNDERLLDSTTISWLNLRKHTRVLPGARQAAIQRGRPDADRCDKVGRREVGQRRRHSMAAVSDGIASIEPPVQRMQAECRTSHAACHLNIVSVVLRSGMSSSSSGP